jgi:predicted extracellular nuclease
MDVEVGSNLYRNTDGIIEIEGVPQIQVALKLATGALLVNFALFDADGKVTAKLNDSTLMINEKRAYEVTKTSKSLLLTHSASGTVILQMEVKAPDVVAITKGEFHTIKGRMIRITPAEWNIDKLRASGTTQDVKGKAVVLG